ncbi:LysR family transcriptional regulator [Mastigocladopsis repens]|uniref:LysR family transcriptional regulator n=1 Tax=Mastigocladopsis repens TaxID=221287 RepID=UPI0002E652C4|nr:LysR family transcriptional regulator [Mastigocladopsis repens]
MDIYQIRYFLGIVETGGFTKAAERLMVSQPSLSAGIKKLEQELGVTLFERGGRRAVLTPAGQFFFKKAQMILIEYQSVLKELKGFQTRPILRLGLLRTIRIGSFAKLIGEFRQQYPNVVIELLDGNQLELHQRLEEGEVDLLMAELDGTESPENSLVLFRQRVSLAVANSHSFAQRKSIRLCELNGQPYIDRIHCRLQPKTKQICESFGINRQIVYRAESDDWVISLVAAGLGVTIMSEWHNLPGITFVPISDWTFERAIGLVWRVRSERELINCFCSFATSHDWN